MADRIEVDNGLIVVERLRSRRGDADGIVLSGAIHEEIFIPGHAVRAVIRALEEIDHG